MYEASLKQCGTLHAHVATAGTAEENDRLKALLPPGSSAYLALDGETWVAGRETGLTLSDTGFSNYDPNSASTDGTRRVQGRL